MKASLAPGVSLSKRLSVDEGRCIVFLGREMMVYSTPSMVNDVEYTCYDAILPHLEEGENSVGSHIEIDHLGPTPLGMEVRIEVKVLELEKRRVKFAFAVHDAVEQVGRGTHTRFVVDQAKTRERVAAKRAHGTQGGTKGAGLPPAGA